MISRLSLGFLISIGILSGCATTKIGNGMNALVGRHISNVYRLIGYPDYEQTVGHRRLLVYRNSGTLTLPQTRTAQTQGTVYGSSGTTTYRGTTTYKSQQTVDLVCELKIDVNTADLIVGWSLYGDQAGCARYARLGDAAVKKKPMLESNIDVQKKREDPK